MPPQEGCTLGSKSGWSRGGVTRSGGARRRPGGGAEDCRDAMGLLHACSPDVRQTTSAKLLEVHGPLDALSTSPAAVLHHYAMRDVSFSEALH